MTSQKWIQRYLRIAREVSKWSKDPSTKVGAVIVGDKGQIISQGYNGFPRGIADSAARLQDRETKYSLVIHAEMNALLNALYNGESVAGATLYVHGLPVCNECAKCIAQAGISKVIYDNDQAKSWSKACSQAAEIFEETGTEYKHIELKDEL